MKNIIQIALLLAPAPALAQAGGVVPVPVPVPFPERLRTPELEDGALSANMQMVVAWTAGKREFTVRWRERSPNSGPLTFWIKNQFTVSTTFRLTDIGFLDGGNEIYAAGMRDDGQGVIKKFTFQPRVDGLQIRTVPVNVGPIGTSTPDHSCEAVVNGQNWSSPASAQSYGVPSRSQVLGDNVGLVRCFGVDPYGRYLLILADSTSNLYMLNLTVTPNTLQLVAEPDDFPTLLLTDAIVMLTKKSGGHVAFLHQFHFGTVESEEGDDSYDQVVMLDADNDGVFETITNVPGGASGMTAAGYSYYEINDLWVAPDMLQAPPGGW